LSRVWKAVEPSLPLPTFPMKWGEPCRSTAKMCKSLL
jgi:hypothetical protein